YWNRQDRRDAPQRTRLCDILHRTLSLLERAMLHSAPGLSFTSGCIAHRCCLRWDVFATCLGAGMRVRKLCRSSSPSKSVNRDIRDQVHVFSDPGCPSEDLIRTSSNGTAWLGPRTTVSAIAKR